MRKVFGWLVVIVVATLAVVVYQKVRTPDEPPVLPPVAEAPPQAAEPAILHPVPQPASEALLPPLNQSDDSIAAALGTLWDDASRELFKLSGFIHRVVATVDNLPRSKAPWSVMPVNAAPGQFRTIGNGQDYTVRPDNAGRYAPYVRLIKVVDTERMVSLYVKFYPLFQQAYQELGYPGAYFNDRVVYVIDHLLAAPSMPADVKLVQPKVFYEFADPALEARSAGEKMMMRIGRDNAAVVKAKLREIRSAITEAEPAR